MYSHNVSYEEPLSILVGRWLNQRGYDLADPIGIGTDSLTDTYALGVLRGLQKPKPIERKIFSILISRSYPKPKRREFLGTIWFQNPTRQAVADNWVFEYHGALNAEEIIMLADNLAREFEV